MGGVGMEGESRKRGDKGARTGCIGVEGGSRKKGDEGARTGSGVVGTEVTVGFGGGRAEDDLGSEAEDVVGAGGVGDVGRVGGRLARVPGQQRRTVLMQVVRLV